MAISTEYERLDALLDNVSLDNTKWLDRLVLVRTAADIALRQGGMESHEWRSLVARSARIQDRINDAVQ